MFIEFFYMLKDRGLNISTTEWLIFMDALDKGLSNGSFTDLYYLGRMTLVKSESDFDKYDIAFREYFYKVQVEDRVPADILKWLDKEDKTTDPLQRELYEYKTAKDANEVKRLFKERVNEQDSEHNGGNYWIGTAGGSSYGHSGVNVGGIRVGGQGGMKSAFSVAGERRYRDFREDRVLSMRQFQVAFRRLRQYSSKLDVPKTELDLEGTIDSTCNNGGYLKLEFDRPRKNTVKLMLLFDCGGSMYPFSQLSNSLFQAVHKANHFKDVKTYYFHNCIYSHLYKTAECEYGDWVELDHVFRHTDKDYKVIIVGDAAMAPEELTDINGNYRGPNKGLSGLEWCRYFKTKYNKIIWLNPKLHKGLSSQLSWMESEAVLAEEFRMYQLSVEGLKEGISYLMASK
jgi:uncharacterized protein with von Willebrand factor type A (vWA) domain